MNISQNRWKFIITAATFLALALLIYFLRNQILDSIANLGRINSAILLLMPIWTLANYHAYTKMYQNIFGIIGEKVAYKPMLRTTVELNFVNIVFPSGGVSGISYFGSRMRALGVSGGKSTLIQLMRYVLLFIAAQVLLLLAFTSLAIEGKANSFLLFMGGSIITLLAAGTLLIAYIAGSQSRINSFFKFFTRLVNSLIHLVRRNNPETISLDRVERLLNELHDNYVLLQSKYKQLRRPLMWAIVVAIAEVSAIFTVYVAFGEVVNPGAIVLAYVIANLAGLVSVLPGGIGIYEGLMTAVLVASGVPAAISIPVTIMYRMINIFLQLSIGYYFYHKTILGGPVRG